MKQIDEILDNLARSIGSRINFFHSTEKYGINFLPSIFFSNDRREVEYMDYNRAIAKIFMLYQLLNGDVFLTESNEKYIFNHQKLIFEPAEEELLLCFFCDKPLHVWHFSEDQYFTKCRNDSCKAVGGMRIGKSETIRKHNEIYRKVHGEKKLPKDKCSCIEADQHCPKCW